MTERRLVEIQQRWTYDTDRLVVLLLLFVAVLAVVAGICLLPQ